MPAVPAAATDKLKKRGRPPKYASAEEKKTANTERRRAQRRSKAVGAHVVQPKQHQIQGPGQATFFVSPLAPLAPGGLSTYGAQLDFASTSLEVSIPDNNKDIGEYLPPLSCFGSPSLGPTPTEPDEALDLPIINSDTLISAGQPVEAEHNSIATINNDIGALHVDMNVITDDVAIEREVEEVSKLANRLTDQLIRHQGCCQHCHQQLREERIEHHPTYYGLQQYLDGIREAVNCLDLLASKTISAHGSNLATQMDTASRRQLYCGLNQDDVTPTPICLEADDEANVAAEVTFDIDSVLGFPNSLAVAKQGVRWNSTQMTVTDLRSGLHLNTRLAHYVDCHGHAHSVRKPLHQLPHYAFGRLVGFEDISLYIFFPYLYREEQKVSRLTDDDFCTWINQILLPVIYRYHDSSLVQHYPSSFDHARYNSTARGVEGRSQRADATPRQQLLFHFLPPDFLHVMWEDILQAIERPGLQQFRGAFLFLQGKNLKCLTKDLNWGAMTSRFNKYWGEAVAESHMTSNAYFDVGKEVCPILRSHIASKDEEEGGEHEILAKTLLWKRCCLETYSEWMKSWHSQEKDGYQKMFYPFSMLHDSGSLTIETHQSSKSRAGGLLYSQFYSSIKEVFAAGNAYPFTNDAIETLALDPKLRKTWQHVGAGLSHSPVALIRAYIYTKLRCHYATTGSMQKSFGTREEHRVSRKLLNEIDAQLKDRNLHTQHFQLEQERNLPHYTVSTVTVLNWLRWNINKFCVGFEMVYSLNNHHFVTWEHTRIMLMFLRCLQFSYSSGLIQRAGGLWQDVRLERNVDQPDGLRRYEGLGFRDSMERHGYAWFMDKVDWKTMTFRQPFAQYMMFNNPSMQAVYHTHYSQVRDVRIDFIRADKTRQWMAEFSAVPICLDLLEEYLEQLCLCAFRKDVFSFIRHLLHKDQVEAALAGQIPLCWPSINRVLKNKYQPPKLAAGNRLAVKSVEVLFSWLWEWRDDQFERKGWNDKPYRMLYQHSFDMIERVRGKHQARAWKKSLKRTFLQSHWLLPYPQNQGFMRKCKESGEVVWWPTIHLGLNRYYNELRNHGDVPQPLPASYIRHHPADGWGLAHGWPGYMPFEVRPKQHLLELSETDLYLRLLDLQQQFNASTGQMSCAVKRDPVRVYEIKDIIEDPAWKRKPMRNWDVGHCSIQLNKELEKYEILQHSRRISRKRKRSASIDFGSEASSSAEVELTSKIYT
ncbi:hypothetical protein L13192_02712 [Pyrenophora tritici-repentis]|nr:hypothetical protein L13192_02712 [Pyrenophora tritici-repentis]